MRDFRRNATETLGRELGLKVGRHDVIETAKAGYRFNAKIAVKNPPPTAETRQGGVVIMDASTSDDPNVQRREQIMKLLATDERLRVPNIAEQLGCSFTTAKREVEVLKAQGQVEFIGPTKIGYYQIVATKAESV